MVRKYVGSILFLCLLIGITIYVLVENNDMRAVAGAMARAEHIWILALGINPTETRVVFCGGRGQYYLLSAAGNRTEDAIAEMHQLVVYRIFLFRYHALCHRRTACPALLYEKGRTAIGRQYTGADGSGCAV